MVERPEKEYPYLWCPSCKKLTPFTVINGVKICFKCEYAYEKEEGGRVVLFTPTEAKLRKLPWIDTYDN